MRRYSLLACTGLVCTGLVCTGLLCTGCAASAGNGASVYAGAYPVVSPMPSPLDPELTWTPKGKPLGPLKPYPGKGAKVIGTIVDRAAGLSYAKLGAPWRPKGIGQDTGGQEFDIKKPVYTWLGGAYSGLLRADLAPGARAAGANRLRAAAELSVRNVTFGNDEQVTPIADAPLKIGGRKAWLAGFRVTIPHPYNSVKERTVIEIAVDAGKGTPSIFEIALAKNSYKQLPDITTLIKSLKPV